MYLPLRNRSHPLAQSVFVIGCCLYPTKAVYQNLLSPVFGTFIVAYIERGLTIARVQYACLLQGFDRRPISNPRRSGLVSFRPRQNDCTTVFPKKNFSENRDF
jgi:hypothetical protein